jgi:predicted outer membrane repeat protein
MFSALSRWLQRSTRPTPARRPNRRTPVRPRLEALEDRCVPAVLFVTKTLDDVNVPGTLRYAVAHANNGDTIDVMTAGPISLTKGQLVLSHDVTIQGMGKLPVVSGNNQSRVFEVVPGAVARLANLEIVDGNGTSGVAAAVLPFDGDGGAILNLGGLLVRDCVFAANTAKDGGAIYNEHGTTIMVGSTLFRNFAKHEGGAVYNDHGRVMVAHSTLSYDIAGSDGGAISNNAGAVTLVADDLSHDWAMFLGGAICSQGGSLVVANSTLSYDTAGAFGGGIFTNGDAALLTGDTLTHDFAGVHGGGIFHTVAGVLRIGTTTASADAPEARFGTYINLGGNVGI